MPIEPGTTLLHYTLTEKIGEGGMGAVWRATDTTLNRDVAIKLLPQIFSNDPDRMARFEREAKLLASLNHPNIAAIYGLHQAGTAEDPVRFLAMELVEGEDLQQRLQQGRLSVDQALDIAVQMAAGIEAAHDKGVVHRDLKPANVIVSPEGKVKLLDFGLAKAFESDPAGSDPSLSPTMTSAGTVAGMLLGTAAYMSPEQARGKPLDRRTDLWSFGCVVYECLTGVLLFDGETVSDSLAAILRKDPDWSRLPDETPPMVRLMLRRCLTRDPGKRLKDAGDARLELEQAIDDPSVEALGLTPATSTTAPRQSPVQRGIPWAIAALMTIAVVALAVTGPGPAQDTTQRLMIPVPGATEFGDGLASPPAVSPDGRFIVFGVTEKSETMLWLRPIDRFDARPLPGTEGANYAFWSPDSRHVGFFQGNRLRRIEVATGRVQPMGGESSVYPRGGSWGTNGKLLYVPHSNTGIHVVDVEGGESRQLTIPDPDVTDSSHRWPHFLPDGEHYLFLWWTNDLAAREEHGGVYLASVSSDAEPVKILADASSVAYASPGYLLVMREDNVIAVPFDADERRVTGEASVIATGVLRSPGNGHGAFAVSAEGTLVYARGQAFLPATLTWYDRSGDTTPAAAEPTAFIDLRLSPDATRAAAAIPGASGDGELWMFDLVRGVRTRMASGAWDYGTPIWSSTGDRLLYTSSEKGRADLYTRFADGSGAQEAFLVDDVDKIPGDWSRDGNYVMYWPIGFGGSTPDLWIYSVETQQSEVLIAGEPTYTGARFSPDARFVVYASDESGRFEVFAHAIDSGARWQVSTAGGGAPSWRDDGREIIYVEPGGRMMAVSIDAGPSGFKLGTPVELFRIDDTIITGDVTGDHQRFLIATRSDVGSEPLHVILGWHAGLNP